MKTQPDFRRGRASRLTQICIPVVILALYCAARSGPDQPEDAANEIDPPEALAHLKEDWKSRRVVSVEVVHFPSQAHFPVAMSPSRLDAHFMFKLIVNGPQDRVVTRELMQNVQAATARQSGERADVRWGFIF